LFGQSTARIIRISPPLEAVHVSVCAAPYVFAGFTFALVVGHCSEGILVGGQGEPRFVLKDLLEYPLFAFQIREIIGLCEEDSVPQIEQLADVIAPRVQQGLVS